MVLPAENRVRVYRIDLQLIAHDFLNRHSKGDASYALDEHEKPLRQDDLPDDARVLFAQIEQDDSAHEQALLATKDFLDSLLFHAPSTATVEAIRSAAEPSHGNTVAIPADTWSALMGALTAILSLTDTADALRQRVIEAIPAQPARHLLVGVESDTYKPASRGDEPQMPFDHTAFMQPATEDG